MLSSSPRSLSTSAVGQAGFVDADVAGVPMFLDGPDAGPREAVHVLYAGEKVRPEYLLSAPDVTECEQPGAYKALSLEALVRMKLTSFHDKDRTITAYQPAQ